MARTVASGWRSGRRTARFQGVESRADLRAGVQVGVDMRDMHPRSVGAEMVHRGASVPIHAHPASYSAQLGSATRSV